VLLGRGWWHEQETRALRLNRFVACVLDEHPSARRVTLTTPVCNGTACHSRWAPRSARTDGAILSVNQARIPFLLSDGELARMAEETGEWAPQFLDVDPVHGAWFALYCERNGIRFPFLKFLLCSYEFLSIVHRRILERVFGVPVLNLYGSTETGHLLMEDEQGAMRPSLDTAFLEVVEADRNGVGDLVVTTLSNDYMPLLRYRIGDLVERRGSSSAPTYVIHGRTRDALRAPDGRRVTTWQVDRCFAGTKGIAHYQLRQAENGDLRLRYVPDQAGPDAQAIRQLIARLESVLEAPGRIVAEAKDLLGPATSGKFRLTGRA
jgi:phenylacetate-CoA ligase